MVAAADFGQRQSPRLALEQPTAPQRKQRVAGERNVRTLEMIADMSGRMPRRFDDAHRLAAKRERVAILHGAVDARNPR